MPEPTSTPSSTPPQATSTPTSSSPGTPSSTPTSSGNPNIYYTPQSGISGYDDPPSGQFWVQHVHQYIEIGWQDLSPATTHIVISRAVSSNGPWATLIEQQNIDAAGPYGIRIADDSIDPAK